MSEEEAYNEVCGYTLSHGDKSFIHQHVVDAYAAQHANEKTKPISLTFALVGLYLLIEKQFSGRQVQQAHIQLARYKQKWPVFVLPEDRGSVTAIEVVTAAEGPERDKAIHSWCASVWAQYINNRDKIAELLHKHGII